MQQMNSPRNLSREATTPVVPIRWSEFYNTHFIWEQGEHVTAIGPTGQGKTTLCLALLEKRQYPVVLACKPRDEVLDDVKKYGYEIVRKWPPGKFGGRFYKPSTTPKLALWPPSERLHSRHKQRQVFLDFLEDAFQSGGYALFADEIRYLTNDLKLEPEMTRILLQGRSLGLSLVSSTQRPRHVPLEIYSQPTHLFLFRESDRQNLQRLSEIGGVNTDEVKRIVQVLPDHHFLYLNTRSGELAVSKYQRKG